jgi:uncharacterized protein
MQRRPEPEPHLARKAAAVAAITGGALAATTLLSSVSAAVYFARRMLTPDRQRPDDTHILAVDEATVTLGLTPETVAPGRYGLWLDDERGHLRLGDVLEVDEAAGRVRRQVLGLDFGNLAPGFGRWNQYYFALPPDRSLGLRTEYVDVDTELGTMPAWVVPAEPASDRWAILVHGRGGGGREGGWAARPSS